MSDPLGNLVSPVADLRAPARLLAERPPAPDGRPIGLVDGMQNPMGMWGQGILDMAERTIRSRRPGLTFERVDRPSIGSPAEIWASTMAARYAALVIAAGD